MIWIPFKYRHRNKTSIYSPISEDKERTGEGNISLSGHSALISRPKFL